MLQHLQLVTQPVTFIQLRLFFHYHILVKDITLTLVIRILVEYLVAFGGKDIAVVYFGEKDLTEAALVNLIEMDIIDVMDVDVVQDDVVLAVIPTARLHRHRDHRPDELHFFMSKIEVFFSLRQTIIEKDTLLE